MGNPFEGDFPPLFCEFLLLFPHLLGHPKGGPDWWGVLSSSLNVP